MKWLFCLLLGISSADAQQLLQHAGKAKNGGGGSMIGSFTSLGAGPTAINLTTLTSGGTDYFATPAGTPPDTCKKSPGGIALGLLDSVGAGSDNGADNQAWTYSLTDGISVGVCTSTMTAQNVGYYYGGTASYGWTFTAPASATPRTLTIYSSNNDGETEVVTATLSDGSAGPYTNSSCTGGTGWIGCKHVITYNSAASSQTLTVTGVTASTGYIGITAATLTP